MAPLANPRNAASGSLRMKDPMVVRKRNLEAILYHISYVAKSPNKKLDNALDSHAGALEMLWQLGFKTPAKQQKVLKGIEDVVDFCNEFEKKRTE